jgi:Ca2+/Na+ antiporter
MVAFLISFFTLFMSRLRVVFGIVYLCIFALWLVWYANIKPSNSKNWQRDVLVLPYATIDKNLIRFHNIRNFKYMTEDKYIVDYYDETFDIDKLNGIDFIATYWMGEDIAHTFLSFSFGDEKHLAISIEVRKTLDKSYSILRGFFKEDEIYYVVADERDLIGLRTNIRNNPPEDVYMYEVKAEKEDMKKVFLNYVKKINDLKNKPEFYNTLTRNCTTGIWDNASLNGKNTKFNWEVVLSGHSAKYLYQVGLLKTYGLTFEELQKRAYINPLVKDSSIDKLYSKKIRGLR